MLDWLVHTIQVGSVYSALGVGFCLYFGAMRLINLAHGDVFTLGAFAGLLAWRFLGPVDGFCGFSLLLVAAAVCGLVTGPLIEVLAYRRIRGRQPYILLLTSVAISIILREGLACVYPDGANPQTFPDFFPQILHIGENFEIRVSRLVTTGILFGGSLFLIALVRWTALGKRMRAVAQDPTAAAMIGINVDRVVTTAFALATAMACVAGCLYGTVYGVVKHDMGILLGLRGFAAAALGGMHRVEGGVIGGLVLAALELGAARLLPGGSAYRDVVVFLVLILVLAIMPQGILGSRRRDIDTSLTRTAGFEGTR